MDIIDWVLTTGKKVVRLMERLGLTQEAAAEIMGVSRGSIASYKARDNANPSREKVARLAEYAASVGRPVALAWFYDGEDTDPIGFEPEPQMLALRPMPMARVPIVGSVSAGEGSYMHPEFGEDIEIPAHMALHPSAANVATGDSMMPWIQPGDIVIARLHKEPRPNLPMLVRRPDGSVSVKIMRFVGGEGWQLVSLNPLYNPEPAKVEILGYVTGLYRVNGTHLYMEFDPSGLRPE